MRSPPLRRAVALCLVALASAAWACTSEPAPSAPEAVRDSGGALPSDSSPGEDGPSLGPPLDPATVTSLTWSEGGCAVRECDYTQTVVVDLVAGTWTNVGCKSPPVRPPAEAGSPDAGDGGESDGSADDGGADASPAGDGGDVYSSSTRPLEEAERQAIVAALALVRVAVIERAGFDGPVIQGTIRLQDGTTLRHDNDCTMRHYSAIVTGFHELRAALRFHGML